MIKMIATVYKHEFKDFLRDTQTLKTMIILLCLLPALYSYLMGNMDNRFQEVLDKEKRVGYLNQEGIDNFLPWLEQQGVTSVPVREVSREVFVKENLDAILTIRPKDELDGADKIQVELEIWTNGTNEKKTAAASFVQRQLLTYGQGLARQNLIMAGAAPQLLEPIRTVLKPLEAEDPKSSMVHNLLIALLGMALTVSTIHLATDTTTGERERMTLESLLYTRAPRASIVLGKFLFVTTMAFIGLTLAGLIFWTYGEVSIFQEILGRTGGFAFHELLIGLAILLPLCPMIAAFQILVGTFAHSVKQAQAYSSISVFLSMPLSFLMFLEQIKPLHYSPIFGQGLAYRKILQGENWDKVPLIVAESSAIALTLIMLFFVIQRFKNEKIILARS